MLSPMGINGPVHVHPEIPYFPENIFALIVKDYTR
jgi:hypothetical protein